MSEITERLRADLNDARRARDKLRTELLTMTLSEVRNREIELRHEIGDADATGVIASAIKRRREAAEQMRAGGRTELAAKEEAEAEILGHYMPPALAESEVRAMVRAAIEDGADSIGAVMGRVAPRIKGRFEGKEANRIAREELA